jgi:hypothetical protein
VRVCDEHWVWFCFRSCVTWVVEQPSSKLDELVTGVMCLMNIGTIVAIVLLYLGYVHRKR